MVAGTPKIGIAKSAREEVVKVPNIPDRDDSLRESRRQRIDGLEDLFPSLNHGGIRVRKNKHGFRGVTFHPGNSEDHKFAAYIAVGTKSRQGSYKKKYLGSFRTPAEAGRAYDKAARYLFGAEAILNFPEEQDAA
jgi:hypothetical protein